MDEFKISKGTARILFIYFIVLAGLYIIAEMLDHNNAKAMGNIEIIEQVNRPTNVSVENKILRITDSIETHNEINGLYEVHATKDKKRSILPMLILFVSILYLASVVFSYMILRLDTKFIVDAGDVVLVFIPIMNLVTVFAFMYIDHRFKSKDE